MIKVAILHYHLNSGGVTSVIGNQLRALDVVLPAGESAQALVLYGHGTRRQNSNAFSDLQRVQCTLGLVPELSYEHRGSPAELVANVTQKLRDTGMTADESLLHIHNHSLGKNPALPRAVVQFARRGYRTLLQVHDFAEDGRPDNYRKLTEVYGNGPDLYRILFPQARHIYYAVVNQRDFDLLGRAGVQQRALHLLPNPVSLSRPLPDQAAARRKVTDRLGVPPNHRFLLYPSRGIRRKNLGEALLWGALSGESTTLGVTLPAKSAGERRSYREWRQFAASLALPCVFEATDGGQVTYEEALAAADGVLTTSVAEGFGMVFVESSLAGRPLVGRDLPEITALFQRAGLQFPLLRSQLLVPLSWIGETDFRRVMRALDCRNRQAFGLQASDHASLQKQIDRLATGGTVDFARLTRRQQRKIIRRVWNRPTDREHVLGLNSWIETAISGGARGHDEAIERNRRAAQEAFSLDRSGHLLLSTYRQLLASPREQVTHLLPNADCIRNAFTSLACLQPVRLQA